MSKIEKDKTPESSINAKSVFKEVIQQGLIDNTVQ